MTNYIKQLYLHKSSFSTLTWLLLSIAIIIAGFSSTVLYAKNLDACIEKPTKADSARWFTLDQGPMIGDNSPPGNFYRYAPSGIQYSGNEKVFYWCGNRQNGVVRDHIITRVWRTGIWKAESIALCPGELTGADCQIGTDQRYTRWDGEHVCDPEVIAGNYMMDGIAYKYAMLYMGAVKKKQPLACKSSEHCNAPYYCDSGECVLDQGGVGVAFSNSPITGPWVKYPQPLIPYDTSKGDTFWGVGQPSGTAVINGMILMFYTQGYGEANNDGVWRRLVDLSNFSSSALPTTEGPPASNKGPILDYHTIFQASVAPLRLNTIGLTNTMTGSALDPYLFRNVSVAYHSGMDAFVIYRDGEAPVGSPASAKSQVAWIPASYIWTGEEQPWNVLLTIDPSNAGSSKAHYISNGGVQRDFYGGFYDQSWLEVFPSRAVGQPVNIFSHKMNTIYGILSYR